MTEIDAGRIQQRVVSEQCHLSLFVYTDYEFLQETLPDKVRNASPQGVSVSRMDDGNVELEMPDRIWAKRPEMTISTIRDNVAMELINYENYSTSDAINRAIDLVSGEVGAFHRDGSEAEMVLEVGFRENITEREFEDLYSTFNIRNEFIKNNFGTVERIRSTEYIFGGKRGTVDAMELWDAALEMQEEMKAKEIIVSCRPL